RLNEQTSATTVWAKAFSQKSGESVLDVQNEIANEVRTRLLAYQGEPHPAAAPSGSPTSQALAFDLYMRARFLLESPSPVSTRAALPYLRQAIDSDPNFALAWSAMADANLALMN